MEFHDKPELKLRGIMFLTKIAFFALSAGPPLFVLPRNMHKHFVFSENYYKLATVSSANER